MARASAARALAGAFVLVALGCLAASGVYAQEAAGSHSVVEPLPDAAGRAPGPTLGAALARLARDPRDVDSLVDAGNAALAMGDTDAAIGFFTRAERLSPGTPRIEAGLAGAKVMAEDPIGALPLFDAAERGAALDPARAGDRGLAYDLVGDNASAQRYYRLAIASGADDEVKRRLALSLAISGDERDAELTLAPLLQKQDRAAWRTRAFSLAILGKEEEAVAIARATMPADLALGIAPYLRYMRRLTRAQQASAANLGHFPQPAEIGVDVPEIAAWQGQHGITHLAAADTALVPAGRPFGVAASAASGGASVASAATSPVPAHHDRHTRATPPPALASGAPPEPSPSREVALAEPAGTPVPTSTRYPSAPVAAPARAAVSAAGAALVSATPAQPAGERAAVPSTAASSNTSGSGHFDLARLPTAGNATPAPSATASATTTVPPLSPPPVAVASPPVVAPATAGAPPVVAPATPAAPSPLAPPPRQPSFAEAFAAFADARPVTAPAAGAVDIRKLKAPRPEPKAPPPPAHPSRIWVQVGVGRDTDRLGFDWRHMTRDGARLFKGKSPSVTAWGRTNRLLVGPFDSEDAANAWLDKAKADHPDAFVWTSSAGQVVDPLDAK